MIVEKTYIYTRTINKYYLMMTTMRRRSRSRNPLAQHAPHHLTAADDARFGRGRSVFPVLDVQFTVHQDILPVLLGTDPNATHGAI